MAAPTGSAAFASAIRAIEQIGDREIRATAAIAARFSDRPLRAIGGVLAEKAPLAVHIDQVRQLATLFTGLQAEPQGMDRNRMTAEIGRRQQVLTDLAQSLEADRAALFVDNAMLTQQERALFGEIQKLRRYALLAARVEDLLEDHIATLTPTNPAAARALETDVLYVIRQRRRDLLMQLAVASQAYASLRLIEQNNLEVIWALRSAATTTLTAIRTAELAAHARDESRAAAGPLGELRARDSAWIDLLAELEDVDAQRRKTLSQIRVGDRGPR